MGFETLRKGIPHTQMFAVMSFLFWWKNDELILNKMLHTTLLLLLLLHCLFLYSHFCLGFWYLHFCLCFWYLHFCYLFDIYLLFYLCSWFLFVFLKSTFMLMFLIFDNRNENMMFRFFLHVCLCIHINTYASESDHLGLLLTPGFWCQLANTAWLWDFLRN